MIECLLTFLVVVVALSPVLGMIEIQTGISQESQNIVGNMQFSKQSIDPHLTNYEQELEYFYLKSNLCSTEELSKAYTIKLISNTQLDTSSFSLLEIKYIDETTCLHTLEIHYVCPKNRYLIEYELVLLDIQAGTGNISIFWKKLCLDKKIPRSGLLINYQVNSDLTTRKNLVKDGVSVVHQAIRLESNISSIQFILQLSGESDQKQKTNDSLDVLKQMVMQINSEVIKKPQLFLDNQGIKATLGCNLSEGGMLSSKGSYDTSLSEEKMICVELECLKDGESEIELLIPLVHFKDIKTKITKQCPVIYTDRLIQFERKIGMELIFLIIFLLFTVLHVIYSVILKNQTAIQSYPFLQSVLALLLRSKYAQKNERFSEILRDLGGFNGGNHTVFNVNSSEDYDNIPNTEIHQDIAERDNQIITINHLRSECDPIRVDIVQESQLTGRYVSDDDNDEIDEHQII